jgi:bacteriorhodopsin
VLENKIAKRQTARESRWHWVAFNITKLVCPNTLIFELEFSRKLTEEMIVLKTKRSKK